MSNILYPFNTNNGLSQTQYSKRLQIFENLAPSPMVFEQSINPHFYIGSQNTPNNIYDFEDFSTINNNPNPSNVRSKNGMPTAISPYFSLVPPIESFSKILEITRSEMQN